MAFTLLEVATIAEDDEVLQNFDKPTSSRICLFQLVESNDINRVTALLKYLGSFPDTVILKLIKQSL